MKRKNVTRNALFTSILSLLLCVSMLVGTTFAWFTDSVISGNNVIAAGNLDIELYHDGDKKVDSSTNLFDGVKWEPGVVIYENFTIKNEGNLALLYDFAINWGDYNTLEGHNLTEILKVAMIDRHVSGNRDEAIAAGENAGWAALDTWSFTGEMTKQGETKDFALIIYWQPSDSDNDYNVQNGKETSDGKALYVNLGINLQATQKMYESDSFGNNYDALANAWNGSIGEVPAEENGVITITTGAELAAFADSVNNGTSYSGKTVQLGADINLGNQKWTPIGSVNTAAYFQGTFDGQGYTISNLYVDDSTNTSEHASAGLFGWVDAAGATIKNVNIDGATVKGSHWVGVIAGYWTGTIENCSVNNATVVAYNLNDNANGDKIGGIVGYLNEHSYINNNTVTNSTITGNRDIGGIAGAVAASTYQMNNNKVVDTVINYSTSKDYGSAGKIVSGRTGYVANDTNVATNVTILRAVADGLAIDEDGSYNVFSADGLAALNTMMVNKTAGWNVVVNLAADIDFSGKTWTPVDSHADSAFTLKEINGNGHTISNLTVNGQAMFTRFAGFGDVVVKDLTFDNATVNSSKLNSSILTVQTYQNTTLDNVDVKNSTITGAYKVAALIASVYDESSSTKTLTVKNCDVDNCVIKSNLDFMACGMVAWVATSNNESVVFENSTISNTTIMVGSTQYNAVGYVYSTNGKAKDTYDSAEGVTVTNCLKLSNSNYSDIYVDADGNMYIYDINGLLSLNSYFKSNASANSVWGKTYNIMADIDATGNTWNSVYMVTGSNANNGIVIDGHGHTITGLTINGGSMLSGTPCGGNDGVEPGYVKNLTMDGAIVESSSWFTGIFWGNVSSDLVMDNVHVVNSKLSGVNNVGALVGSTGEFSDTVSVTFKNCSVKNTTITANGADGQDPTGASAFIGRAYGNTKLVFEGSNAVDGNTITNNNGLVGGIYAYTVYSNGWSGTGSCDTFTNWNGIQ